MQDYYGDKTSNISMSKDQTSVSDSSDDSSNCTTSMDVDEEWLEYGAMELEDVN